MKLLFFSNIPNPYQLEFISSLQQHAEVLGYFLWNREKNRDWHLPAGKNCHIADFRYRPYCFKDFKKTFTSYDPDIVLIAGYSLPLSTYALYLCHKYNKQVIHWLERPLPHGPLNYLKKIYTKVRLSTTSLTLAIGEQALTHYQPLVKEPIINFPYNLDLQPYFAIERCNQTNKTNPEPIKILFSGQFIHRKNVLNLVKAARQIPTDLHPFKLTLIGSGKLKKDLEILIGNDKRFNMPGFIQPEKLPEVYKEHDIFILPGRHDGWGVVITEAMAAAMPIIGTKEIGAVNDYIKHEDNGFICETTPNSIRTALLYYFLNPQLITEHGKKNRSIIQQSPVDCHNGACFLIQEIKKVCGANASHSHNKSS